MRENIAGVFTNDPSYDWHLQNLNLYSALDTRWPDASSWGLDISGNDEGLGQEVLPVGLSHGTNLLGLPASYTPAARFVRMFVLRQFALANNPPESVDDGIRVVQGLLNNVHIVKGSVSSIDGGDDKYESTEWSVVKVPKSKVVYYRDYSDMRWRKIELGAIDFGDSQNDGKTMKIATDEVVVEDVTNDFA